MTLREKWERLQKILRDRKRALVAFSGGCDSTFLLAAARGALGRENILAVTAVSASLPSRERRATQDLAQTLDVPHRFIETDELSNPAYAANPMNRCFFCKNELFGKLAPIARENEMSMVDGFNVSDRSDYRPGFQASVEWRVAHPLDDAALEKKEIRMLSRWLRLPTWNKPASPCLSSRVPYGSEITPELLHQIEEAEAVLHAERFSVVRVRHYGDRARIEVPIEQLPSLLESERWSRIQNRLRALGYAQIEADPRGFSSGRLNEAVKK